MLDGWPLCYSMSKGAVYGNDISGSKRLYPWWHSCNCISPAKEFSTHLWMVHKKKLRERQRCLKNYQSPNRSVAWLTGRDAYDLVSCSDEVLHHRVWLSYWRRFINLIITPSLWSWSVLGEPGKEKPGILSTKNFTTIAWPAIQWRFLIRRTRRLQNSLTKTEAITRSFEGYTPGEYDRKTIKIICMAWLCRPCKRNRRCHSDEPIIFFKSTTACQTQWRHHHSKKIPQKQIGSWTAVVISKKTFIKWKRRWIMLPVTACNNDLSEREFQLERNWAMGEGQSCDFIAPWVLSCNKKMNRKCKWPFTLAQGKWEKYAEQFSTSNSFSKYLSLL